MTGSVENPTVESSAVRTSVEVAIPPDAAFALFTTGFDRWWPHGHHLQQGELAEVGIDPQAGGAVWERMTDGRRCEWGTVLRWDPPTVLSFSWRIGIDWGVPAADAPASRVTVTFTATDGGTHVELVHDKLEAHGPGWESIRDSVGGARGWTSLLAGYTDSAGG